MLLLSNSQHEIEAAVGEASSCGTLEVQEVQGQICQAHVLLDFLQPLPQLVSAIAFLLLAIQ